MKLVLSLFIFFVLAITTTAQDPALTPEGESPEPSAFLRALSLIPDIAELREGTPILSYADYHAALEARGMAVPDNLSDYLESGEAGGPLFPALPQAGPTNLLQYLFAGGPEYPQTVGFDFFEIEQAVEIGLPPSQGQILIGDFDNALILGAYEQRGYTAAREGDLGTLLCHAADCTSGRRTDPANLMRGNPFGGHLGRREPIFVGDGVLLNSPNDTLVEAMAAAYEGSESSLADAPDFQALASVLAEYPYVSAVMAVSPLSVSLLDPLAMTRDTEAAEALLADLETMPLQPYQIAAFASVADGEREYGLALLVYVNAEAAQQAAASIDERLAALKSVRTQQTYADLLAETGTLEPAQVVSDDATGLSVVVVRVTTPQPVNEEVDGQIVASHRGYVRFLQMLVSRDTNWLSWSSSEE